MTSKYIIKKNSLKNDRLKTSNRGTIICTKTVGILAYNYNTIFKNKEFCSCQFIIKTRVFIIYH